jgi:hypothetical protein
MLFNPDFLRSTILFLSGVFETLSCCQDIVIGSTFQTFQTLLQTQDCYNSWMFLMLVEPLMNMIQRLTFPWQRYAIILLGLATAGAPIAAQADEPLTIAQQIYPLVVADLQRQCASPKTLSAGLYMVSDESEMVGFTCWSAADDSGQRTGQWLGRLPVSTVESFGEPLTCKDGDELCDRWLPILEEQYPTALEQAEFHCAMRNGTLFTQFADDSVTVRCGFFASTLYDENGDDLPDYEDQISVDIPVTTLPLVDE